MYVFTFDGSFEGVLTCVYESFYKKIIPGNIVESTNVQYDFINEYIDIVSDKEKSEKVYNAIIDKISTLALENVYYLYLSERKDAPIIILNYLKLGFKLGKNIDNYISNEKVLLVHKIAEKVRGEVHRIKGLLRFKKLKEELYYSELSPDYNILFFLAPHFANRFKEQNFVIHDVKRKIAILYNRENWVLLEDVSSFNFSQKSSEEDLFQRLWKEYYKSISIEERKNSKLQKRNMPVRYWKHLIEKTF